jgi:predicted TIM-barrel fold metal-dependent hydrolase
MTRSRFDGLCIIDADTHLTEPHDLWTARAPKGYEDRVPQVHEVDGVPSWTMDGKVLSRAGASGVVGADGVKVPGTTFFQWNIEDVHRAAYDVDARVELMDEQGIWAQIVYPNTVGFGGQKFFDIGDETLRRLSVELYNDAMAEIQERSGQRLFPMGIVPWWDVDLAVAEIERMATLGLRGLNTSTAPHDHGLPDLGDEHWNPMWEAASSLDLPVNFHIGASESSLSWFGSVPWPSLNGDQKLGLGSAMMYLNNAGVIGNIIYTGVLERFPTLQIVSVESGVGWIPFLLKALDYQVGEMTPGSMDNLSMTPSEYFRRQIHSCFWFERSGIAEAIDSVGAGHLMFETDFPHPTCVYPDGLEYADAALESVDDDAVAGIMGLNAARLYRIPLPASASS